MEYLVNLVTTVPEGTSAAKVDELRSAEEFRAAELAKTGHLIRLWRPPLGPGASKCAPPARTAQA